MKTTIITFSLFVLAILSTLAQTPDYFNYQAVARNSNGDIIADENVNFTISILHGAIDGTIVYSETHSVTTNQFGLVTLQIGNGTNYTNNFSEVEWDQGMFFIEVKLNDIFMGTTQLLSVPYAKFADKAGNSFSGDYNDLINLPTSFDDEDSNPSNELQHFSVSMEGDTLFLSQTNFVIIPGISFANSSDSETVTDMDGNVYQTINIGSQVNMKLFCWEIRMKAYNI